MSKLSVRAKQLNWNKRQLAGALASIKSIESSITASAQEYNVSVVLSKLRISEAYLTQVIEQWKYLTERELAALKQSLDNEKE